MVDKRRDAIKWSFSPPSFTPDLLTAEAARALLKLVESAARRREIQMGSSDGGETSDSDDGQRQG